MYFESFFATKYNKYTTCLECVPFPYKQSRPSPASQGVTPPPSQCGVCTAYKAMTKAASTADEGTAKNTSKTDKDVAKDSSRANEVVVKGGSTAEEAVTIVMPSRDPITRLKLCLYCLK